VKVLIFVSDAPPLLVSPYVTSILPNATAAIPYANTLYQTGAAPGTLTWSITAGPLPSGSGLSIGLNSGTVSGTPSTAGPYTFTAQVTDSAGNTGSLAFTVKVLIFVSDAAPLAGSPYVTTNLPNATAAIPYSNTLYETGAAPGTLTWNYTGTLPPGITPNPANSNMLSGTPTTAGTYNFTAQVTDSAGNTGSLAFCLKVLIFVSDASPLGGSPYVTPTLPNATAGTPYSNTLYETGAATGTLTWNYTGTLPPGITPNPANSNTLSGTPTTAGTYMFTAQVTDSAGNTGSLLFTLQVLIFESDSGAPAVTTNLPAGTVGSPYSNTIDESGGTGTLTWSITAGALPPGLSLGLNSGTVSGTPTAPGNYNFTVQVTDTDSPPNVATLAFMLSVADAQYGDLIVVDGAPTASPLGGTLFRITPTGTSGTIAAISNGSPTGVAVDSTSGNIYVAVDSVSGSGTSRIVKIGPTGTLTDPFVPSGVFTNPVAVAVDASGNVYVGDNSTNAIYEFNSSGASVGAVPFASLPSSNSMSNHIRMAFDSSGNLDVASDNIGGVSGQVEVDQIASGGALTVLYNTKTKSTATYALTAVNASTANITSFAITSNVVTFQAANNFSAGTMVLINGLSTGTYLDGQVLTVLASGLSSTLFEANFTYSNVASTPDTGTATAQPPAATAAYTGTFSPTIPANALVTIAGFTNAGNNGQFTVVSCTSTTLVVNNANAVVENNSGTATLQLTQIGTVGGIAALSGGSIDVADYGAQAIYNITNPGAANMAITTAISTLCCNISGMANPPGAPTTLFVTLTGATGTPQLQQAVPATSTVTTVNSTQTYALTAVSAASGGNTTYNGSFSPTIPANAVVTITGFTNAPNNGQFTVVSCSSSTLVVNNSVGVAETNPGTAVTATQTYTLTAASAVVSGNTTYTGTFSPTIPANAQVTITGFTNATNNGTFTVVSCSGTQLVVMNSGGVTETNPGTAVTATPLTFPNDVAWYRQSQAVKLVFATPSTYPGNLGGVAGANAICQAAANAGGLPGTYKAWLSDDNGNSPSTTFTQSTVGYVLPNGNQVAPNWSTLILGTLTNQINVTPEGNAATYGAVWSYSLTNGTPYGGGAASNCSEWTSSSSAYTGTTQEISASGWTFYGRDGCQPVAYQGLACFQQ
jgi:hypothetical protein